MIEEGKYYEFKDKKPGSTGLSHDGIYLVTGKCEMKDSEKGWIPAIMYQKDNQTYVRDEKDFEAKFKEHK